MFCQNSGFCKTYTSTLFMLLLRNYRLMLIVSLTNAKSCGTLTKMPNNIFDELDAFKKKKN